MREISTRILKDGEHIVVDGVEYVAEEHAGVVCKDCDRPESDYCHLIPCATGIILKRVETAEEQEKGRKQDKDTPMTYPQLAEWLAKGHGHAKCRGLRGYVSDLVFYEGNENEAVNDDILIRPWGTDEWAKPTLEIYERDCR